METKAFYIKRILTTLGIGIVGLMLATGIFTGFELFEGSRFLTAVIFAGLPFGWMAVRQALGVVFALNIWLLLFHFFLTLVLSLAIGWAIFLFRLIRDVVQLIIVWQTTPVVVVSDQV